MDPSPDAELFRRQLRTIQIIGFALIAGVVFFLILVVFLVQTGQPFGPIGDMPILTYIAAGVFVIQVVMWQAVPKLMVQQSIQKIAQRTWTPPQGVRLPIFFVENDAGKLLMVYQTQFIVGMALLEGAGFLACIAYLIEGELVSLVLASLLVMLMLSSFPFGERVQRWIDLQTIRVEEVRRSGGPSA